VLTPDGRQHDYKEYLDDSPFGCLVKKELGVAVPVGGDPAHVDLMRSKELVDYEPASDVGCLRWMPKGKIVRDLLGDYVLHMVLEYGGTPVETPVMYDLGDKAIYEHAEKFGERQYRFKSNNRNMMLRFAACFGMFSIMRDMHISPNHLPMKMYELSTYSFRHEQKGEVIGLKRLRCFTMPDMHSLCLDMPQALKCFEEQLAMGWQTGRDFETKLVATEGSEKYPPCTLFQRAPWTPVSVARRDSRRAHRDSVRALVPQRLVGEVRLYLGLAAAGPGRVVAVTATGR